MLDTPRFKRLATQATPLQPSNSLVRLRCKVVQCGHSVINLRVKYRRESKVDSGQLMPIHANLVGFVAC